MARNTFQPNPPPFSAKDRGNVNDHPAFVNTIQSQFPGTLSLDTYFQQSYELLKNRGFEDENTMGMVSVCRDELTDPFFEKVIHYWGKTFNCCSLAGFVTMGKTGLAAAMGHTPIEDGVRRFVFYAMPHIAMSRRGEIGKVYREGIRNASHACGALEAIVAELDSGRLHLEMDMQDIEQTIVRQKILSTLTYGEKPDLVAVTKLAAKLIRQDVEKLLATLDRSVFNYAIATGIQVHGPFETNWIYPLSLSIFESDGESEEIWPKTDKINLQH